MTKTADEVKTPRGACGETSVASHDETRSGRARVTIPDKVKTYPPILIGWTEEVTITRPETAPREFIAAICERCGIEIARSATTDQAQKDLRNHRGNCRPAVKRRRLHQARSRSVS